MLKKEVLVTYTFYPSGNQDLRNAVAGLEEQFPLRNLHWKSSTRPALRTIQEVDIKFIELGDVAPAKGTVSASVLDTPLVNVCFVSCDDDNVYKNNTRSFIKDWLALLQSRKNGHTSVIVLVNAPTATGAAPSSKNVFGRDKGIIAKLKADFNHNKRDICAQINLPPAGTTDPAAWPDVVNKLKESLLIAFDSAVVEREEEVKRGEAQRVTVGWNFCTWFLLKESLANSFEGVNLYEDALVIYEELEAAFLQVQKEQNLSWFGALGGTGPRDDSLPILDTDAKPYRDLLIQSNITVFDFRVYVFARQCQLLGKIGRITEIAKRGQWFVASLARRLREAKGDLPEFFIESWTFTACMDLVARCDEWSRLDRPSGDYSGLIAYESARSELLDVARIQVERIGVATGKLPDRYPYKAAADVSEADDEKLYAASETGSIVNPDADPASPRPALSNQTFMDAIKNEEVFFNLYEDYSRQALQAYQSCGKVNSMIRIKTGLAALALYAEHYDPAFEYYRSLAKDCLELHVWDRVTKFALEGALMCHAKLGKEQNAQWVAWALEYLNACAVTTAAEGETAQLEATTAALRVLTERRQVPNANIFKMRILDHAAELDQDVSLTYLNVEVENTLPVNMAVDKAALEFDSDIFENITYATDPMEFKPGKQVVKFYCSTSIAGPVTLRQTVVTFGAISFIAAFPKNQLIVPVHRNLLGLRTVLRMPTLIDLDQEKKVALEVHAGKQAVAAARLVVASQMEEVGFMLEHASCEGRQLDLSSQSIGIGDLAADEIVTISVPFAGLPRGDLAKTQIVVQYETSGGRVCTYIDQQTIDVGLPILVNVQDFFRPDVLVSSFTIASDGREYVRVGSVELKTRDPFSIEPCRPKWDEPLLVTPTQPMSCLFKVRPSGRVSSGQAVGLLIKYQTVTEEVDLLSQAALDALPDSCAKLGRAVRNHIEDRPAWLQPYLLSSDVRDIFDDRWRQSVSDLPQRTVDAFISALQPSVPQWRTLRVPVEIPLRRLLTTVTLTLSGAPMAIYEGRALAFDLELSTSLAWLGEPPSEMIVSYELTANAEDWAIAGKKRGVYVADPASPQRQSIVLVPVRHGSLALPPVSVQLVNGGGIVCETYIANAAQGVKVLPSRTGMTTLVPIQRWEEQ
ncbi:hypothetical protein CC85DRAFT_273697 [Cutaneotrichosporon oleaginosum]|uniref:Trafficking protein particle complex subunit 11 domain-containing protein n=1 Tax=Cutaneotrichosporon oleaginosum TaxID=879819 RepID=A0A0J0XP21_9TREE|nr:uncharacterized protein CC85DRAFT_273697 [Cutaneotrichosporon oleaginosum]KLT42797.1 hypothetical protein CC85DRAFT_273697 [Cutaneotrichosporon oleaginosum]TXT08235.1 hypothetical protein COLE_05159 [Cutaneotrichosporon oleaginosum]